jgi:hypothetical protein
MIAANMPLVPDANPNTRAGQKVWRRDRSVHTDVSSHVGILSFWLKRRADVLNVVESRN